MASHKKFETKYNLPFTLLSDTELTCIQAYDVWKEKNMYGKKTMGVVRTTYLIDEKGMIVKAFGKSGTDAGRAFLNEDHHITCEKNECGYGYLWSDRASGISGGHKDSDERDPKAEFFRCSGVMEMQ